MKQKFFVTSDIHSSYTPLKKALDEKGFDPNNETHWLVICGDCFDRLGESKALLKYLMSLKRKILVKGNHDLLLEELCLRGFPYSYDKSNGTTRTVQDISGKYSAYDFVEACDITLKKTARYRELLVNYFETQNYIFVHSWIVVNKVGIDTYEYREDWRNATDEEFELATWGNPFVLAAQDLNKTGKIIVFGHFHTSYQWSKDGKCSEFGDDAIFDPYFGEDFIALDACTAYTNKVNVIMLEDEFIND